MVKFKIRFPLTKIVHYASKYPNQSLDDEVIATADTIKQRGYLLKEELQFVANWKTPRSRPKVAMNESETIKEITGIALSAKSERVRVEVLTLLQGVSWPTASTILHFYHNDRYPILDFRALHSLNAEHVLPQHYTFEFWQAYTDCCRMLADKANVSMRTLDQALWQYSKDPKS